MFLKHLQRCKHTFQVVHFRGTTARVYNDDEVVLRRKDNESMKHWLRRVMQNVAKDNIQLVIYYGHTPGKQCKVKLNLSDFTEEVLKIVKPICTIFDACYMADIDVFLKIRNFTQYVIASPSFHPYTSVLDTKAVFNINRIKQDCNVYVKSVVKEFMIIARKEPKYTCLFGFDLGKIHNWDILSNDVHCQKEKHLPHDKRRFDFVDCVADVGKQDIVRNAITASSKCHYHTNGIGITCIGH